MSCPALLVRVSLLGDSGKRRLRGDARDVASEPRGSREGHKPIERGAIYG